MASSQEISFSFHIYYHLMYFTSQALISRSQEIFFCFQIYYHLVHYLITASFYLSELSQEIYFWFYVYYRLMYVVPIQRIFNYFFYPISKCYWCWKVEYSQQGLFCKVVYLFSSLGSSNYAKYSHNNRKKR